MCCSHQYLSRASSYRYSTIHLRYRDLSLVTAQIPCTLWYFHHTDTVLIGLTVPSCSQIPCCLVVLLMSNCSLLHTVTVLSGCIDHHPCSFLHTDTVLSGCIVTNCHSTQIPSCLFVYLFPSSHRYRGDWLYRPWQRILWSAIGLLLDQLRLRPCANVC